MLKLLVHFVIGYWKRIFQLPVIAVFVTLTALLALALDLSGFTDVSRLIIKILFLGSLTNGNLRIEGVAQLAGAVFWILFLIQLGAEIVDRILSKEYALKFRIWMPYLYLTVVASITIILTFAAGLDSDLPLIIGLFWLIGVIFTAIYQKISQYFALFKP